MIWQCPIGPKDKMKIAEIYIRQCKMYIRESGAKLSKSSWDGLQDGTVFITDTDGTLITLKTMPQEYFGHWNDESLRSIKKLGINFPVPVPQIRGVVKATGKRFTV